MEPSNPISHTVDLCIVFGTSKCGRVFLDRVDSLPSSRERKGNGVPAHAAHHVEDDGLARGHSLSNMLGDFAKSC